MTDDETKGLGFEGWMRRFEERFETDKDAFAPSQPMDDLEKMRWLHSLDHRYMMALPKCIRCADENLAQEIQQILADYEKLLQKKPPKLPIYDIESVRSKCADTHCLLASCYESMQEPNYDLARNHLTTACDIYAELGKDDKVRSCQERIEGLTLPHYGDVDQEIARLRKKLDSLTEASIEYVDVLVELGGLYRTCGDDYEAEQLLLQAKETLDQDYGGDVTGQDLANSLIQSVVEINQGRESSGSSLLPTAIRVNNLYRLIYVGLARIYKSTNPQLAAEYLEQAAKRDSREQNDEFSQLMLQSLNSGHLRELFLEEDADENLQADTKEQQEKPGEREQHQEFDIQ